MDSNGVTTFLPVEWRRNSCVHVSQVSPHELFGIVTIGKQISAFVMPSDCGHDLSFHQHWLRIAPLTSNEHQRWLLGNPLPVPPNAVNHFSKCSGGTGRVRCKQPRLANNLQQRT